MTLLARLSFCPAILLAGAALAAAGIQPKPDTCTDRAISRQATGQKNLRAYSNVALYHRQPTSISLWTP